MTEVGFLVKLFVHVNGDSIGIGGHSASFRATQRNGHHPIHVGQQDGHADAHGQGGNHRGNNHLERTYNQNHFRDRATRFCLGDGCSRTYGGSDAAGDDQVPFVDGGLAVLGVELSAHPHGDPDDHGRNGDAR